MDNNKEKYLSESLLSEEPKKKYVLKLKNNSVTGDKIAPNAVNWDKLSQRIKDLFVAIQAAIGEPVDPETIKEMIKNVINDMIESGEEIVDIDTIAEKVAEIIQVENKNFIPFDGVMPKGTSVNVLDVQAPQSVEGNVLFYPQTGTFIYRVYEELEEPIPGQITPPVSKYYKYWEGWTDYKDAQDTPKSKVVFVLRNGSAYYYWDGSELQEFVTETSLASTIAALDIEAVPITGNNGVKVVETTEVIDDKTVKIKTASLADISKETTNMIGTTYVFGNTLPTNLSSNTKYVVANNVGSNTGKITLPSGSKIVPNGGMPTVAVEGGEMSWVHSSDIGMIQATDEEINTGNYNVSNGEVNREILRKVINSKYNLILDGYYYIHFSSYPSKAIGVVDFNGNYAIKVDRDFSILNGGLITRYSLFYITKGKFHAENVFFSHKNKYGILLLDCRKNFIDSLILTNCKFSGASRAVVASGADCMPSKFAESGTVRWTPFYVKTYAEYYKRKYSISGSDEEFSLISRYEDYYASLAVYASHSTSEGVVETLVEKHPAKSVIYYPTDNGTHKFVIKSGGTEIHDEQAGYFTLVETIIPESEGVEKKDSAGNVITYSTIAFEDTCDLQGIGTVEVFRCTFDEATIQFADLTVTDAFSFRECTFNNVYTAPISFSTTNTYTFANDWNGASCPLIIENNMFKGAHYFKYREETYCTPCLAEVKTIYFRNNIVEDFVGGGFAVYDLYVSSNEVYVENNTFKNILPAAKLYSANPTTSDASILFRPQSGIFKSKSIVMTSEDEEYYAENGKLPFRVVRIYKNNKYIVRPAEIHDWVIDNLKNIYGAEDIKNKLAVNHSELITEDGDVDYETMFERYTLNVGVCGFVTSIAIDEFVVENNDLDLQGCYLISGSSTGTKNLVNRLVVRNNTIKAKYFPSANKQYTDNLRYYVPYKYKDNLRFIISANRPIFAVNAKAGNVKIDISDNRFIAEIKARINILGIADMRPNDSSIIINSLSVENNIFENCDFRIVGCYSPRNLNAGERDNCYGEVYADTLYIRNNKVAADCDVNYTLEYGLSARTKDGTTGTNLYYNSAENCTSVPSKFRYNKGIVDIETTQYSPCYYPMVFIGPSENAELIIRSKKIIRPSVNTVFNDNTSKTIENTFYVNMWNKREGNNFYDNFSIDVHIPIPISPQLYSEPHYGFVIEYVKGGIKTTKRLEAGIQNDVRTDDSATPSTSWVNGLWRTFDGQRMSYKAYDNSSKMYAYKEYIDDIGLYCMIIFSAINIDGNRMAIHVSFFTGINGTTNDAGTDIVIKVVKLPKHDDIKNTGTATIDFTYNNTTPIKEFVQEGSLKSSEWRSLTNEFGNGTSTGASYIRNNTLTPILAPIDRGFWVRDSVTLRKYTWNGASWDAEKRIVSLTQAEYDAIVTKDADTLYLITDSQS